MHRVTIICRELLMGCCGDKKKFKALAFAMRFKALMSSSVIKGYTIQSMAELMHCSYKSVNKYMGILESFGLIRWFYRGNVKYMQIKSLRHGKLLRSHVQDIRQWQGEKLNCFTPKNLNVKIDFADFDILNMNQTAHVLQQYALSEVANHKAFLRNSISLEKNRRTSSCDNHPKRASRRFLASTKKFVDYGISIEGVANIMGCGRTTATKLIKQADQRNIVWKVSRVFYGSFENCGLDERYAIKENFKAIQTKSGETKFVASNIYLPTGKRKEESYAILRNIRNACMQSKKNLLNKTISTNKTNTESYSNKTISSYTQQDYSNYSLTNSDIFYSSSVMDMYNPDCLI